MEPLIIIPSLFSLPQQQKETASGTSTKVKVLPRMERSPPPPASLSLHSLGSSLELTEKKLNRRQSEKQLLDSITLKVSNLLSMKASGWVNYGESLWCRW